MAGTALTSAKELLAGAGKKLQLHLEVESFRADAAQAGSRSRPGNITFNWQRWLQRVLADEATLMAVNWTPEKVLNDVVGETMVREAAATSVPLHLRHFLVLLVTPEHEDVAVRVFDVELTDALLPVYLERRGGDVRAATLELPVQRLEIADGHGDD